MSELKQVKASAGSGKTYQLTRRFLGLLNAADDSRSPFVCTQALQRGYLWPEILAVTFTNKAAAEMKERVVCGLKEAALDLCLDEPACSPHTAFVTLEAILRRYHRLNIRTIDSLLSLLLRLFALEFRIRPDFQLVFDETELFDAAYDRFLSECEENEETRHLLESALTTLIRSEGRSGFWMQDRVRNRLSELIKYLRTQSGPLQTDQETIRTLLTGASADFRQAVDSMERFLADTGLPGNKHFTTFLKKCLTIEFFDPPPDSKMIAKESLRDCILAKGKDKVDDRAEAEYIHLQQAFTDYQEAHAILAGAYFLAPAVTMARQLADEMEELQRERGVILGAGLARIVGRLFEHGDAVSEAYCRMGCRLHHLLVDEFQDTSREQWQAIVPLSQECLAKGGSLYYVGDVKQAIYGWRGGDSALFDEIMSQPDLSSLALNCNCDTLPNNWRSFENVVDFNNTFFANLESHDNALELAQQVLPDASGLFLDDFASELVANFTESSQAVAPKHIDTGGYVRMERLPGGRTEEIENQALEALDTLLDDLTGRRRYGDIAILVRKHDHATLVCDLLVEKGIPVITENSLQLDRHPIVRQLAALLSFLDFPRDDLAFLTFISGQECFGALSGLDQSTIIDWLNNTGKCPLGVQFRQDFPDIWKRHIEPFYNQSGLMTPYDLVREAIRVFHIFERHPDAELYIRRFLEVIHLAEEKGYTSLSAFLEFWTEKSGEEKVPLPESIDAVRIMTIHKSKGLEFPVVIVPFHHWPVQKDRDYAQRSYQGHRLLTPMRKELGKTWLTSMARSIREQLNLLYVTWTRAREELYGFFTEKPTSSPALTAMNLFLDMDDGPVYEHGPLPSERSPSPHTMVPVPTNIEKITSDTRLMDWLPRLRVYRHNRDEYFYNERLRGEVAHKTMEHLRVTGNNAYDIHRAVKLAMEDFPILDALNAEERAHLQQDLSGMAEWALQHPDLRIWLDQGELEPELMDMDGSFKRLDLLYRDNALVVADFKTGQPDPKNREQVLGYMRLLRDLYPDQTPVGYLIYLDLREIHEVREGA